MSGFRAGVNTRDAGLAYPFRCPRKDFDAIVPTGIRHGRTQGFGQLRSFVWSREITEGSLAHGREDVSRSKFIGEDDQANVRAGTSNFSKKLNIFRDASFPPGDDQIEWLGSRNGESTLSVIDALNAQSLAGQYTRKQSIDVTAGRH